MKLKIISDGTSAGTRVIDRETGVELEGVKRVRFDMQVGQLGLIWLELENHELEIIVEGNAVERDDDDGPVEL